MKTENDISVKITELFRQEYGKLTSVLTKIFGTSNIELAEDVVQEALLEALNKWSKEGIPNNPTGWIYKVAKYKAVNIVNREKYKREYASEVSHHLQSEWTVEPALAHIFTDKEIEDDQLRMIFTCCHPSISSDSQVALTLKTLCGFSIPEIVRAFLTNEENINKRLVRARKTIKEQQIPFEVPIGNALKERLDSVLETIYLLFNEGYNASSGDHLIRYELCEEAIRLTEMIASNHHIESPNTYALLGLMSLNISRFNSRIDEFDNLLDMAQQDRSKWDKDLIKKGLYYLEFAAEQKEISIYHILATISAHHCTASTFESTDWKSILSLYDLLLQINRSPIVLLNRAVVLSKTNGPQSALKEISKIKQLSVLASYLPYYTTKAELHFQNQETQKAISTLKEALKLPLNQNHKTIINSKLEAYSKKN